jgi:hypothetical protein
VEVVLDTVSLKHLLRNPKQKNSRRRSHTYLETAFDAPMRQDKLCLALDSSRGLLSEWEETCGKDVVRVIFTRWSELNAIKLIDALPPIRLHTRKRLRQLGFNGTIDNVVLRLGMVVQDHIVISDDSDFWNPMYPRETGNKNAPVARLCREELGVIISLLSPVLSQLRR